MPTNQPTLRTRVEKVSRPLLVRMSRLPRPVVLIATLALVAVGMLAPLPLALVALALVFAFVAWVAYLSWPVVTNSGRLARLVMLMLIVALAWLRF